MDLKVYKDSLLERVIRAESGCWEWQGPIGNHGYGRIYIREINERLLTHRVSYIIFKGEIPEGLVVDHTCRNRSCINPEHLDPKSIGDNVLLGESIPAKNKNKTHCHRGHEFTPENTYIRKNSRGRGNGRDCKACAIVHSKNRIRK